MSYVHPSEHGDDQLVHAVVGVLRNGTIAINMTWYYIIGQDHWDFLAAMLSAGGFPNPKAVNFARNKPDEFGKPNMKVDWNQLRISRDQIEMVGLVPQQVRDQIIAWMQGPLPWARFGLRFDFGEQTSRHETPII